MTVETTRSICFPMALPGALPCRIFLGKLGTTLTPSVQKYIGPPWVRPLDREFDSKDLQTSKINVWLLYTVSGVNILSLYLYTPRETLIFGQFWEIRVSSASFIKTTHSW